MGTDIPALPCLLTVLREVPYACAGFAIFTPQPNLSLAGSWLPGSGALGEILSQGIIISNN